MPLRALNVIREILYWILEEIDWELLKLTKDRSYVIKIFGFSVKSSSSVLYALKFR